MSVVESWFAPAAAVAEPLPRPRPRRQAAAKPKKRQRRGFRVRAPLLWMAVFALLLVGIVTLNVAVLRAHVSVNDLDNQITQLEQHNADLASRLARATAAPRVEAAARSASLVQVPSLDTGVIDMRVKDRAGRK